MNSLLGSTPFPAESAARPPADLPLLDAAQGLRYCRIPATYRKLLARFAQDYADAGAEWAARADAGELWQAARTIHTLKGVAPTLGLARLGAVALDLNCALAAPGAGPAELEALAAALRRVLDDSLAAIRSHLGTEPAAAEPTPAPCGPADPAAIGPLLRGLRECLALNDPFRAEPWLAGLAARLPAGALAPLRARLEAFDFRAAEAEARSLGAALGISPEG
jgi:HPt (histidine-containing phosphotransfer) domain-containing protein